MKALLTIDGLALNRHLMNVKGIQRADGTFTSLIATEITEWALGVGPEYVGLLAQSSYPNLCFSTGSWSLFIVGSGKPEPGGELRVSC